MLRRKLVFCPWTFWATIALSHSPLPPSFLVTVDSVLKPCDHADHTYWTVRLMVSGVMPLGLHAANGPQVKVQFCCGCCFGMDGLAGHSWARLAVPQWLLGSFSARKKCLLHSDFQFPDFSNLDFVKRTTYVYCRCQELPFNVLRDHKRRTVAEITTNRIRVLIYKTANLFRSGQVSTHRVEVCWGFLPPLSATSRSWPACRRSVQPSACAPRWNSMTCSACRACTRLHRNAVGCCHFNHTQYNTIQYNKKLYLPSLIGPITRMLVKVCSAKQLSFQSTTEHGEALWYVMHSHWKSIPGHTAWNSKNVWSTYISYVCKVTKSHQSQNGCPKSCSQLGIKHYSDMVRALTLLSHTSLQLTSA